MSDFDLSQDDGGPVGGLPLRHIPFEDETRAPRAAGQFPDDWLWQDPNEDVTREAPDPGTLRVSVPSENEFYGGDTSAPRILQYVSGDFDLQGDVLLESQGKDLAITEFLIYAPGSYLGSLAGQMDMNGAAAHYRILGGGWLMMSGLDKLLSIPCSRRPRSWSNVPTRPQAPSGSG